MPLFDSFYHIDLMFSYTQTIMFIQDNHLSFLQVVQEYERAVIFRLGRLLQGGSKGPGMQVTQIFM